MGLESASNFHEALACLLGAWGENVKRAPAGLTPVPLTTLMGHRDLLGKHSSSSSLQKP